VKRGIVPAIERALASRPRAVVTVAILMLVGLAALRFITDQSAYMLFSAVPIVVLGMMFGVKGGLASALVSSAAYLTWALTGGQASTAENAGTPFAFFTLGLISGVYAGGALGVLDLRASGPARSCGARSGTARLCSTTNRSPTPGPGRW